MTAHQHPIAEASAFFDMFLQSDWASCHVRGGGIELFVSRAQGHANPFLGDAGPVAVEEASIALSAPHLGTLVDLDAVGSVVAAGARYGAIEVLGERIDLIADHAGTIRRHLGRLGTLVEFDHPIVALG